MDIGIYRQVLGRAAADLRDDHLFQQAIQGALELGLFGERELGQEFGVSRSQVVRWKNGCSLPGLGSRKVVYDVLCQRELGGSSACEGEK